MASTHEDSLGRLVYDVAIGIIYGNLLAIILLLHELHVADADLADALVLVNLEQLLHLGFHLVVIEQAVDELQLLQGFGTFEHHQTVGIGIQRVYRDLTAIADGFHHIAPEAIDVSLCLLAVGVAHAVLGIHFSCTLIFSHLDDLHLDAHLGQQILHEHRLGGNAVPVDFTVGIQPNLVGNGAEVVGALRVGVAIGYNPLARLLEVE